MSNIVETKKIMRNAIMSYAEKRNDVVTKTQIKIYTESNDADPKFNMLQSFKPYEEITLNELMLVPKFDMLLKGFKANTFVKPAIKNILLRLAKENNLNVTSISVVVATDDMECEKLKLMMCINNQPYKRIKFKDIIED